MATKAGARGGIDFGVPVEGRMEVLFLHQSGVETTVGAVCGSRRGSAGLRPSLWLAREGHGRVAKN